MSNSKATTDIREIQQWAETRNGKPARVKSTGTDDEGGGVLRINIPGAPEESILEDLTWDEWFRIFEDCQLAFVYEDQSAAGQDSSSYKMMKRDH